MLAVTAEENTESTNAKGIEFANPNLSQERIASMEIGTRFLAIPSRWKDLQHFLPKSAGRIDIVRPHENDFACMLAKLFNGPCEVPLPPAVFSEPLWTIQEMEAAVRR